MADFRTIIKHGYEEVALWRDPGRWYRGDLRDSIRLRLGPAIGGTRWQPYADLDAAFADVLRLSQKR